MQLPSGRIAGSLYKNPIDCLWKTITTEGPLALYKGTYPLRGIFTFLRGFAGSTAHFLRIAPHT